MSTIHTTLRFWIAPRGNRVHVVLPGDSGLPESVENIPLILRAQYISPDVVEAELERGATFSDPPHRFLIVRTGDGEAPPAHTALLFAYEKTEEIHCKIGMSAKRVEAHSYAAVTSAAGWVWNTDLIQGKYGYFLTGGAGQTNLWRIRRAETDFANRLSFTIVPVAPSSGLPNLNLASMHNNELRQQVGQHWREFVEVFNRQLPNRTVNAAKDICENLIYDVLQRHGTNIRGKPGLDDLLKHVSNALANKIDLPVPLTWLQYHQIHKIRELHARTHAGRVATQGPISPEVALSVATDLVEVLTAAGLVAQ